jgi:hypothetical protein
VTTEGNILSIMMDSLLRINVISLNIYKWGRCKSFINLKVEWVNPQGERNILIYFRWRMKKCSWTIPPAAPQSAVN